jgi:hypothetical protein
LLILCLVYSNKRFDFRSLNNENSVILSSEWNANNSGGSHTTQEEFFKKKKKKDEYEEKKKILTWLDNPKFELIFTNKEKIQNVKFEIFLARSETLWGTEISRNIINSMMGLYIFRRDISTSIINPDNLMNLEDVHFAPKVEIISRFEFSNVHPDGFVIMPTTYGAGIKGPFTIMVNCEESFIFKPLEIKKR